MVHEFLNGLTGSVYKILPLKEDENPFLSEYLDSLVIQLKGAEETYPELSSNVKYIYIVNIIQYFCNNPFTVKQCKREVFKCIRNIDRIQEEV